jgi:Tat protein secretion system quality control protein TatD with DNase activity
MIDQEQFTELKTKYNIPQENNLSNSNFLYFILAKAEIDINFLNNIDWEWLLDNFTETYEILEKKKELYDNREKIIKLLRQEQFSIFQKYSFIFESMPIELSYDKKNDVNKSTANTKLSSIILKIDANGNLSEEEINYLNNHCKLIKTELNKLLEFFNLKRKYKIINYPNISTDDRLYSILKKLEEITQLTDKDVKFIKEHNLSYLYEVYELQQEKYKQEFSELKQKYNCSQYLDKSLNSPLYAILKTLKSGKIVNSVQINWLNNNQLNETSEIATRSNLKIKYKVPDSQVSDKKYLKNLYEVLKKIDSNILLTESDIKFLQRIELFYLVDKEFDLLREKYQVTNHELSDKQLYLILRKLELEQLLEAVEVAYLEENKLLIPRTPIYVKYFTIKAQKKEDEYKKNKYVGIIPSISSCWRKVNEPQKALEWTTLINITTLDDDHLKSRFFTTKGAAYRDIYKIDGQLDNLNEAQKCAEQAIKFQPESHHPYTLMGAICFDLGDYDQGVISFEQAIERLPKDESIRSEIENCINDIQDKEKRRQVAEELFNRDPEKYSWAEQYRGRPILQKGKK